MQAILFGSHGAFEMLYTKNPAVEIAIIINIIFIINYFPNLILQAVLIQPLYGVMIMSNRYDNAHLCARQSKVYKFYDLSTAQVLQTKAQPNVKPERI